jgi:hypothetical protein
MGLGLSLLVAVTSFLAAPSLDPDSGRDSQYLETLVFNTSLPAFIETLHSKSAMLGWFDQSSDLCSAPIIGSTGRSFDFAQACERHDFAYRNYKLLDKKYSCFVGGTVPTGCGLTNAFAPTCLLTVAHVQYGIARSVVLGRKFFSAQFVSLADCRTSSLSGQYPRELNGHYFRKKFTCFSPLAFNLCETRSFNGFARSNIFLSDVGDQ